MKNTADVTGGKPIAVLLQSISGVSAINHLVAFYDIHGGKREVLFFYFVPDTTRDRISSEVKFVIDVRYISSRILHFVVKRRNTVQFHKLISFVGSLILLPL
jgi:hypothetical protein